MKNELFLKLKFYLEYFKHGDESVLAEIKEIDSILFQEFDIELNFNLLEKETKQGKTDILKYYIFQFFELSHHFKQNSTLLDNKSKNKINDPYLSYLDECILIFNILFNEIQLASFNYGIDFIKICDELKICMDFIDAGITDALIEPNIHEKSKQNQLTNFETALRHSYLVDNKIKGYTEINNGSKVGKFYESKNIELAYNSITAQSKFKKIPSLIHLQNVLDSLNEFPLIQEQIQTKINEIKNSPTM